MARPKVSILSECSMERWNILKEMFHSLRDVRLFFASTILTGCSMLLGLGSVACSTTPMEYPVGTPIAVIASPTPASVNTVASTPTVAPTATLAAVSTTSAQTANTTPTIIRTPTRTTTPQPSAKDALVAAYNAALSKIKTYRVKVILDPTRQDDPERIVEVILPDHFRQIQPSEMRGIGNTVYLFEPLPARYRFPGLFYVFGRVHLPSYAQVFAQVPQATFIGRTTIDGVQTVGYQTMIKISSTNISAPQVNSDQPIKIWFSTTDGFPVRMEVGQPLIYINVYYDFNAKIDEIGPP